MDNTVGMKLANKIQRDLIVFAKGTSDIIIPNFYYNMQECDLFRVTNTGFVLEYEIKISRGDFFADFKKGWGGNGQKHDKMKCGDNGCPNRFYFVVPDGLVKVDEVPSYAGLIYHKGNRHLEIVKAAKLIHKEKFTKYKMLTQQLSGRAEAFRGKYNMQRNYDYEKEITDLKRQVESAYKSNSELMGRIISIERHGKTKTP